MTFKAAILSILTLFIAVFQRADASDLSPTRPHDQPTIVLNTADLRSAYLQRAGVVRYDQSNTTPTGLRQQLQHHFDAVLNLLCAATPQSLETALIRLQSADDHPWTPAESTAWRQKLLAARLVQFQRLAAYRDRGLFPLNEGQSIDPAPIFVDRHGTACAVGHLMRCSGWTEAVDSIAKSNNLVYVPDAPHSLIAAWVLTSGLTSEEAALIQPTYRWPAAPYDASTYEPGESALEKDGLRFSNFKLQAQNYDVVSTSTILPTSVGALPTLTGLGLNTAKGSFYPFSPVQYPSHIPNGTNWIAIGGSGQLPFHSLNALAAVGKAQMVVITFDVATIALDQRINSISETSDGLWQGFQSIPFGRPPSAIYYLSTTAFDGTTSLASIKIDQTPFSPTSATQSFAPRQQITVETTLWLQNAESLDTYMLDFNVITAPEPASLFLAAPALAIACLTRNHRRKS